ncbi:hypothetical protein VTJ49DRAFT_6420 [Mycothermus thermophilus]|uniref:Uncharacterized protein n=1 Tax=Humicola insolens TaxID=85995 RepID=A0ABR3VJ21_HUMIN
MAPTIPPPTSPSPPPPPSDDIDDIPLILREQTAVLTLFLAISLLLLGAVFLGDRWSRVKGSSSSSLSSPTLSPCSSPAPKSRKRRRTDEEADGRPSEMTPLLSSESTLIGPELEQRIDEDKSNDLSEQPSPTLSAGSGISGGKCSYGSVSWDSDGATVPMEPELEPETEEGLGGRSDSARLGSRRARRRTL